MSAQPDQNNSLPPQQISGSASQLQVPTAISIGSTILAGQSFPMHILTCAQPKTNVFVFGNYDPTQQFTIINNLTYTISYETDGNLIIYNEKGDIAYPSYGRRTYMPGLVAGKAVFGGVNFDQQAGTLNAYHMNFVIQLYDANGVLYNITGINSSATDYYEQYGSFFYIDGNDEVDSKGNYKFRVCTTSVDTLGSFFEQTNEWTDVPDPF